MSTYFGPFDAVEVWDALSTGDLANMIDADQGSYGWIEAWDMEPDTSLQTVRLKGVSGITGEVTPGALLLLGFKWDQKLGDIQRCQVWERNADSDPWGDAIYDAPCTGTGLQTVSFPVNITDPAEYQIIIGALYDRRDTTGGGGDPPVPPPEKE